MAAGLRALLQAELGSGEIADVLEIASGPGGLLELQGSGAGRALVAGCRVEAGRAALERRVAAPQVLDELASRATDWGLKLAGGSARRIYGRGNFAPADLAAVAAAAGAPWSPEVLERWAAALGRGSLAMIACRLGPSPRLAGYVSFASVPGERPALVARLASLIAGIAEPPDREALAALFDRDRDESAYASLSPPAPRWVKLDVGARSLETATAVAGRFGLALPPAAAALYADPSLRPAHLSVRIGEGAGVSAYFRRR